MGGLCGKENKKVNITSKIQFKLIITDSRSSAHINTININSNSRGEICRRSGKFHLPKI